MHRVEKRALTRARLIEAALNVFAFGGYEHATVDDIAHAAGLSKGAFYFNFNSKEEILVELVRQWTDERLSLLHAASAFDEDAAGRLRVMAETLASYRGGTNWPPLVLEFWSQALRAGVIDQALKRAYRDFRAVLLNAVQDEIGVAAGATVDAILAVHDGAVTELALGRAKSSSGAAHALVALVSGKAGRAGGATAEVAGG